MNMNELESKQGADSSAGLPTQPQPQMTVLELKLSADSSDEESWLQASLLLDCKTSDSLERSGEGLLEKGR
jgi:hypothetical protein